MEAPDRLSVSTCIGCGAMGRPGTCETGCSEHKLELVRAGAYDTLSAAAEEDRASAEDFADVARTLAGPQPAPGDAQSAYRSAQRAAREALHRHPDVEEPDLDRAEPVEPAVTWWCPECGGIDAPQPCLGVCIWRPVDWVNRTRYEELRERAVAEHAREQRLRGLLRRIAWITPRPGHWEHSWQLLVTEARDALAAPVPPDHSVAGGARAR